MKKLCCLLTVFALVFTTFGCNWSEKRGESADGGFEYVSFEDSLGRNVSLKHQPKRVAILFSSFASVWMLAGGTLEVTVYESVERGFAPKDAILVDTGAGKSINTELLLASAPDLVIASADIPAQVACMELLEKANIPCAYFKVESFSDYLRMLKICTDITGNKEALEQYGTRVEKEIEDLLSSTENLQSGKKILFIRAGSTQSSTKAKNAENNFVCAMLDDLGCENIADSAKILLDGLSVEEIIVQNPEIIFVSTMGDEAAAVANVQKMLESDAWSQISAVKNGKVHYLPKEMFQYKPNEKWGEAYKYLYSLIYDEKQ